MRNLDDFTNEYDNGFWLIHILFYICYNLFHKEDEVNITEQKYYYIKSARKN
jgi:hypothetical protein